MALPTILRINERGETKHVKVKRKNLVTVPYYGIDGAKSNRILEWSVDAGIDIDFVGVERHSMPQKGVWSLDPKYHSWFKLKWS